MSSGKTGCCHCCIKPSNTIVPFTSLASDYNYRILEIRPSRYVCIHYYNPCPRSPEFGLQMENHLLQHKDEIAYRREVFPRFKKKSDNSLIKVAIRNSRRSTQQLGNTSIPVGENGNSLGVGHDNRSKSPEELMSPSELTMVSEDSFHQDKNNGHTSSTSNKESSEFNPLHDYTNQIKHPNKVIFFIHGVGGSADVWKGQCDYFASKGYEVIVPEWIGHGLCPSSSSASDYNFSEILKDLTVVFDLHCKKINIVIGHSYGSCFAAVLARTRPRLVEKLMLISGGAPTPLAPQPGLFKCPTCLLVCCKPILKGCFLQKAFYKTSKSVVPKDKAFDVPTYVIRSTMNGQQWREGTALYHRGIDCQTYLVHGIEDQLISVEEEIEMADAIYGSCLYIISEASHMVMMEQPEQVNNLIEKLIQDGHHSDLPEPMNTDNVVEATENVHSSRTSIKSHDSSHTHVINTAQKHEGNTSNESTPKHYQQNSPSRPNRSDLKSAKSIPGRLFSARR